MKRFFATIGIVGATTLPVNAAPDVVTDIAPVHSIVARVMAGVGEPSLLLPPGASPHGYAMRPSDARSLQNADLIFWVGPGLTPWLDKSIDTLGTNAEAVVLHETPGTVHLSVREGARFEAHDHDHGHGDHDDHDDHDSHKDHADHEGHDDHAAHDDDHGTDDPHSWLDPRNAALWAKAVSAHLAEADPENATLYSNNAAAFGEELTALEAQLAERLTPLRGQGFIVFHDAYHYFEARFDIEAAGAIAASDAARPGAARLRMVRETIRDTEAVCLFTEIQQPVKLARTVAEGMPVRIGTLDPVGAGLTPGPALYPALLEAMTVAFEECLREENL